MGLALDEPKENDAVEIINRIQVAIEQTVLPHTESMTLDYQETPQGSGIVITSDSNCC
ncbi:MAG: HesB/YadR/YfhF-family protein [Bacilli bacterium]|nr:HesB/YadR/YfhF-family protein [Bacilli bacterium]